jgi:uncharacterized protein (DUF58 family)
MLEDAPLRKRLDWGRLAPLRVRARAVAEGVYTGVHRSRKRGAGIEFGGHRSYVPGDDLRFLDRRATMRHDRLLVREFETETDRGVRLVLDASRSMGYRSEGAPAAKLAFAAVVVAALARVSLSGSDTVSLDWIGGDGCRPMPPMGGREAFDRIVDALETVEPAGDVVREPPALDRALSRVARFARRGSAIVVVSDFLDLPDGAKDRIAALASGGRVVVGARILDPAEVRFPFDGPVRFRASEGALHVETDAGTARAAYLEALAKQTAAFRESFLSHGGRFVEATTEDDPVLVLQEILLAIEGAAR